MFELNGPIDLFEEIKHASSEYSNEPNSRLFLFLVFSLNHLREWIAGGSATEIRRKAKEGGDLTKEERFALDLWNLSEFRIVNSLCNKSKHISASLPHELSTSRGLHVGGSCGDSLDQLYYEINGVDSRNIFFPVMKRYYEWFAEND